MRVTMAGVGRVLVMLGALEILIVLAVATTNGGFPTDLWLLEFLNKLVRAIPHIMLGLVLIAGGLWLTIRNAHKGRPEIRPKPVPADPDFS